MTIAASCPQPSFSRPHDNWELITGLFGGFEGALHPSSRIEAMIAAHVRRDHMGDITTVYDSRWWDYRRLSLGHSFMMFTRDFYASFRRAARQAMGQLGPLRGPDGKVADGRLVRRYQSLRGTLARDLTEKDIWDKDRPYIATMWKAMVAADLFGIPYPQFCQIGFRVASDHKWERVPSPRHLYSDRMAALIVNGWEELTSQRAITAKHPMYLVENYEGHPVQDAYREWLIRTVSRRQDDIAIPLSIVVFDRPQLPEDMALAAFGANTLRRARSMAA